MDRLYEALETGSLEMDDLAPRIKSQRQRHEQLVESKERIGEEPHGARNRGSVLEAIKNNVRELREILDEGSAAGRKSSIKSFVKGIEITGGDAVMGYTLPLVAKGEPRSYGEVLSIVYDGRAGGTIGRTFEIAFSVP